MTEYTCVLFIKNIICTAAVIFLELHEKGMNAFFQASACFPWVIMLLSLPHTNILFIIYEARGLVC